MNINQPNTHENSRRRFLRSASLGLASSVVAGTFPSIAFGGQKGNRLALVADSIPGCFSIRSESRRLIERAHWKIECEEETIESTGGRYRMKETASALHFTDSRGTCDVRIEWEPEEEGSLLAFSFSVMNTSGRDIHIKNIYPILSGLEAESGLYFWQIGAPRNVLTDEWERCYGSAGAQDASSAVRSAWDVHLFDAENDLGFTLSYYQIPNSKLSFMINPLTGQQRSTLAVRCDTHAGMRGVLVRRGASFTVPELMARLHLGSCFDALESYALLIAHKNNVQPPPVIPIGWVDWYFAKARTTEDDVLKNLDFIAHELKDFGLEYIQIDSGWQLGVETMPPPHNVIAGGPWIPNWKFHRGMKWFADEIKRRGLKPGIWIRPFHSIDGSRERTEHPEWFNEQGQMDFSHRGVRAEVENLLSLVTEQWGFEYVKYDFPSFDLFNAWGPGLFEDHAAHAELSNPEETSITAYRGALEGISRAARGKAYLLACNSVMPATIGWAEVFRIGDDVGDWERTFRYGVRSVSARYYTNGVFWTNDPDCLLVREPFTQDQARMWASLIALSGGVVFISEYLPTLPSDRLDIIKKAMPVYKNAGTRYGFGRPIDFLENNPPTLWDFQVKRPFADWHIVGLFNWSQQESARTLTFKSIGLDHQTPFHLVDFWKNRYLGTYTGSFQTTLPSMTCQILAVHKEMHQPLVVSTSRHILQGAVEIRKAMWDGRSSALHGISHVVGQNPYEVMIYSGHRTLRDVHNASLLASEEPGILRLRLSSDRTTELEWSVSFDPQ
ncbi:MAG: alpha-galactosidase [Ignavibacteriales bacterium]|nr:alpha-galactosidase [Ignavibacteriales bacterium]